VVVVPEAFDASEQALRARTHVGPAQLMAHFAIARVRKAFRGYSSRIRRRAAVAYKARRMSFLGLHIFRVRPRLSYLLVTIGAARAFA
jgi:hypothetical protein